MNPASLFLSRLVTVAAVGWALLAAVASGQQLEIYLNVDHDQATGCSVATADGVLSGIEQQLQTVIGTQAGPLEQRICDEPAGQFGPAFSVVPGTWPVGQMNGTDGANVVELAVPLSELTGARSLVRIAAATRLAPGPSAGDDALTVTAQGGPLLIAVGGLPIPTLGQWALLILAVALATLAVLTLRRDRGPGRAATTLLVFLLLGAAPPDGLTGDWTGISPLALDPLGDAAPEIDLRAIFARVDQGYLHLRLDVFLAAPAQALVFMTSTEYVSSWHGAGTSLAGADIECQRLADASSAIPTGRAFKAWLSEGTVSPATRFNRRSDPYALVDGTQIAPDWAGLVDGMLDAPIRRNQGGGPVSGSAWTGTLADGTPSGQDCNGWIDAEPHFGTLGSSSRKDAGWSQAGVTSCQFPEYLVLMGNLITHRLYCFEQ